MDKLEDEVLSLTNTFRQKEGQGALQMNEALSSVARKHAAAMADGVQSFSHDGASERFQDSGLLCHNFAENLSVSTGFAREVMAQTTVDGWIASEGHRRNLLGPFNVCGIGWSTNDNCQLYITQLLAFVDLDDPSVSSKAPKVLCDLALRFIDSTPAVCAVAGLALAGSTGAVAGSILGGAASAQWGVRPSTIPCAVLARAKREVCPARCTSCGAVGEILLNQQDRSLLCSRCHPAPEDSDVWQFVD